MLALPTNQYSIIIFLIELALGLGLGYFSAKVVKYVLALIGIFVLGILLNIWATPNYGPNLLGSLGTDWAKLYPVLLSIIYVLGLTTVLPITVGLVIGVVIAIAR